MTSPASPTAAPLPAPPTTPSPADTACEDLTATLNAGGLAVVIHGHGARGRGGLVAVAALMTPANATLMAVRGRGLLSVVMRPATAARLGLQHMPGCSAQWSAHRPYYLASIEAAACTGTGISAADRALTMRMAGSPRSRSQDVRVPGHVMPMLVPDWFLPGCLPQYGQRLVQRITGFDVAAWCDVLDDAGDLASSETCLRLATEIEAPIVRTEISN